MTAAKVTNNSDLPLAIGGVSIPPGRTIKVDNWDIVKGGETVQAWLGAKAITAKVDQPIQPETPKAGKPK